jgi:hypothetical protein
MFNNIKYFFKNLWHYKGFLWNNRWWDHHFIFEALRYKLNHDIPYYEKYGMSVNSHLYAKKMKLCVMLLNRIIDDNYLSNVYKYHDEKWGDLDMIFNDDNSIHIYRPKVITEEDKIQERKEDKILRKREDYLQKQDINFLFDTMKKHILTWWD